MRTTISFALACTLAGCGSVAPTIDPDAGVELDEPDAEPQPQGRCDPDAPFGTPVLVAALNGASADGGAQLSPDEKTVYFHSSRGGDFDLYVATRASADDAFGAPIAITGLNTTDTEAYPTVSRDGLVLYFMRGGGDVYKATRAAVSQPFENPIAVAAVNTVDVEQQLTLGPDALGFSRGVWGEGDDDLYQAKVQGDGSLAAPTKITALSIQGASDMSPVASYDGLSLIWGSDRLDGGAEGRDLWTATRATPTSAWGVATRLPEVSSAGEDTPTWRSDDDCLLLLNSNRAGSAAMDIYVATRP